MSKRYQLLVLGGLFILVAALAIWPGSWLSRAYANVTLTDFSAYSVPGLPEVYVGWGTGTEIDTIGFYIQRSTSANGNFTRVSASIPHDGDSVTGAEYSFLDETSVLNVTYYYRLEVVNTDQSSDFYGPIKVVAGAGPTITPTPTRTPMPYHLVLPLVLKSN